MGLFDKFEPCSTGIIYGFTNVLERSFYSCLNFYWRNLKADFMKSNATETRFKTLSEPYIKLEGDSGIKNSDP